MLGWTTGHNHGPVGNPWTYQDSKPVKLDSAWQLVSKSHRRFAEASSAASTGLLQKSKICIVG
jgi:hypothetical protein